LIYTLNRTLLYSSLSQAVSSRYSDRSHWCWMCHRRRHWLLT